MHYYAQLVTRQVAPAGIDVGNVITEVSAVITALAALATIIIAARTLKAAIQANTENATERRAADAERMAAEADRRQARADRERDRQQAARDRYRSRLERIADAVEEVGRMGALDHPAIPDDTWKRLRESLRVLMSGLGGKFPSVDALLDIHRTVTGGMAANAVYTARTELQAEIDHVAAADETANQDLGTG